MRRLGDKYLYPGKRHGNTRQCHRLWWETLPPLVTSASPSPSSGGCHTRLHVTYDIVLVRVTPVWSDVSTLRLTHYIWSPDTRTLGPGTLCVGHRDTGDTTGATFRCPLTVRVRSWTMNRSNKFRADTDIVFIWMFVGETHLSKVGASLWVAGARPVIMLHLYHNPPVTKCPSFRHI